MIAPAKTGRESRRSRAVIKTDHTNNGVLLKDMPRVRIFIIVVMKLIAPKILDAPAKCKEKIAKSTDGPE